MAFKPSSTIYLCNVPIDASYKNQIYFADKTEQKNYFEKCVTRYFTEYLTVRKTLPDGSFESYVRVNANIDNIRAMNCNYMYYTNEHHSTKTFYAFITKLIYINEATTEIRFETDVYQTWLFDVELLDSYVVREHAKNDGIGDNLVPEKFNFQDYDYEQATIFDSLNEWGYLVTSTEQKGSDGARGKQMSGIYQGLYFYYFENINTMNEFLDALEDEGGDCIQSITLIPKFCISNNTVGDNGWLNYSSEPASHTFNITTDIAVRKLDGYKPKNNKMYTSPFFNLVVTNHNGEEACYNIEDFYNNASAGESNTERTFGFTLKGDVSINPSVTLYPNHYKGIAENYDSGISISGFPQCSFNSDTFKLWLAKNQFGLGLDALGNVGQIVAGVATAVGTGGAGSAIGVSMVASGVSGVLGSLNGVYQASKEPNKSHSGSAKNNLLTAIKKNKFDIYYRSIKFNYARTVDDFFTMYGYQTNRVKVPNVNSRPCFNYVQTIDINIVGNIPSDDMIRLKQVYNSGVTLWKHTATVGDYSVDNK